MHFNSLKCKLQSKTTQFKGGQRRCERTDEVCSGEGAPRLNNDQRLDAKIYICLFCDVLLPSNQRCISPPLISTQ